MFGDIASATMVLYNLHTVPSAALMQEWPPATNVPLTVVHICQVGVSIKDKL